MLHSHTTTTVVFEFEKNLDTTTKIVLRFSKLPFFVKRLKKLKEGSNKIIKVCL